MKYSWTYLKPKLKKYFWNILISIDQFFNTVFGGDPDETISSRVSKIQYRSKAARLFCKFLSLFDKRHCEDHVEPDEGNDNVIK